MFCFRSFLGVLATGINNFCLAILFICSIKITSTNYVLGAGDGMMMGRKSISPFLGETGTEEVHRGGSITAYSSFTVVVL